IQIEPEPSVAVNRGDYRMIREVKTGDRLFDLRQDKHELTDVINENPEVAKELRAALDEYVAQSRVFDLIPSIELNDMELRQLRALGYMVE
ncbi:MAG: sulfatase, partial [Myxococcota bacterium]